MTNREYGLVASLVTEVTSPISEPSVQDQLETQRMAFDENLAARVRQLFDEHGVAFEEKRMMGGLCFMVDDKMCVGVEKTRLMVRIDPEIYESALGRKGCVPMDFTGRPMRGFVFVDPDGITTKRNLAYWVSLALEFNPRAVSSKKKQSGRQTHKKPSTQGKRSK